ncbi:MCA3A oxidase, partial [Polypterus senegalus]|nr:MCA3A oxidase [Polypterus senegalus]
MNRTGTSACLKEKEGQTGEQVNDWMEERPGRECQSCAQELELEDRQSRLQQILRERMSTDDSEKTEQDCAEEEKILNQILAVVEERNDLVAILDEQRLLEKAEDEDLECILLTRGYQFNWS